MIRADEAGKRVSSAYFMLAQGEMITDSSMLSSEAIDSPYTLEQVWGMGEAGLDEECKRLDSGLIEARGLMELIEAEESGLKEEKLREKIAERYNAAGKLYINPPCMFCDFKYLCGLLGGSHE